MQEQETRSVFSFGIPTPTLMAKYMCRLRNLGISPNTLRHPLMARRWRLRRYLTTNIEAKAINKLFVLQLGLWEAESDAIHPSLGQLGPTHNHFLIVLAIVLSVLEKAVSLNLTSTAAICVILPLLMSAMQFMLELKK